MREGEMVRTARFLRLYVTPVLLLGATSIKPGRINALGALLVAITVPKVNRERIFKRRRTA
jgi:hypothetical protein